MNSVLVSLFSNIDATTKNNIINKNVDADKNFRLKQDANKKKPHRNLQIHDVIKAAFLLKKHTQNGLKTIKSKSNVIVKSQNDKQSDNQAQQTISKEYIRYFVSKTKPYRRFRPFDDPLQYTKDSNSSNATKKRKLAKGFNSLFTVLNNLNLDDDEIRMELYKYNRAVLPYKNFKYYKTRNKLYFTGLARKSKQLYIQEAIGTMSLIHDDMRHQYYRNPFLYIKRYFENDLSFKDIQKNNVQQIFLQFYWQIHERNPNLQLIVTNG